MESRVICFNVYILTLLIMKRSSFQYRFRDYQSFGRILCKKYPRLYYAILEYIFVFIHK